MTRLPTDSWDIKPRTDLHPFELNKTCAHPDCHFHNLENHHIWRRSFGAHFGSAWWIEDGNGRVWPNRVGLCNEHHRMVTENEARIVLLSTLGQFAWETEGKRREFLNPQPGVDETLTHQRPNKFNTTTLPISEDEIWTNVSEALAHAIPDEGEVCPNCKRRVPHSKKKDSPKTRVRSHRVPEDIAETAEEQTVAAAKHLGVHGKPHWKHWTNHYGEILILQGPANALDS